jgi:flavin-dependent dehydrogenase
MRTARFGERSVLDQLTPGSGDRSAALTLVDGSRVAVVGGGPAGSFFSYFLLKMTEMIGVEIEVDIYEPREFGHFGPGGCNHCGGIVSESLVQLLAAEGIVLPPSVVQRGIDSYVLHMDVGTVRIATPVHEKRIAAVFRGNGPRGTNGSEVDSFDRFLLELTRARGAHVVRRLVSGLEWREGRPSLSHPDGPGSTYDLVAIASGVNSRLVERIESPATTYRPPTTMPTFICEFRFDAETVMRCFGPSMHVFLLDLPRLEFAALIPKGDVVTLCLLGHDIDDALVRAFLDAPEVRACFPGGSPPAVATCTCSPNINVRPSRPTYGDRFVVVGDGGVTRLYKDGIGAAYRTAKAAAAAAVFEGISERAFRDRFAPACRRIANDNRIGRFIFTVNHQIQRRRVSRRAILRMVSREQAGPPTGRPMSEVLWDLFTGSAPYREVFGNTLRPGFLLGIGHNLAWSLLTPDAGGRAHDAVH